MTRAVLVLALLLPSSLALAQGCGPQNPNCVVPTAPPGTSNNQAASTKFVGDAIAAGQAASGTPPVNGGTCPIANPQGGNRRGSFVLAGSCAAGTITLTFATVAATNWFCRAVDYSNPANTFVQTVPISTTTATFTGTGADGDVIGWECGAF